MPSTSNATVQYSRENANLNKLGAAAAMVSVVVAILFPPLAIFALLAAVASAGVWYYAGEKTGQYANTLEKENTAAQQKEQKKKAKLAMMQERIQGLEGHQHHWAEEIRRQQMAHHHEMPTH